MQVSRWGNSLAIRLPAELVRAMGLQEGDEVDLEALPNSRLGIARDAERAAIRAEIERLARPLPPDYRFDREEANAR